MANSLINKLRGLFGVHDGGDVSDVKDMAERLFQWEVVLPAVSGTANTNVTYSPATNCKLVGAKFIPTAATASTAANTVFLAINTNGVEVCNDNTDGDSLNALAAMTVETLTVNTANSFVDADEDIICYANHQDGNACNGHFVLVLRHED